MRRSPAIAGAWLLAQLAALPWLSGCERSPGELAHQSTEQIALDGRAPVEFRRNLQPGVWLIEVREKGIDVRIDVEMPGSDGDLLNPVPRLGVSYQVAIVTQPIELRLRLHSVDHVSREGTVELRVSRFARALQAPAGDREKGFAAWSRADAHSARAGVAEWNAAARELEEALRSFARAGAHAERGMAAYSLANVQLRNLDQNRKSLRTLDLADESFRALGDEWALHVSAQLRGSAEFELANGLNAELQRDEQGRLYQAAEQRLAIASEYFSAEGDRELESMGLNLRGVIAIARGAEQQAEVLFTRALSLAQASDDVLGEIRAMGNLAWIHRLNGEVARAADEYAGLLPLLDSQKQTYAYAVMLNNYGFCLSALGEFDRALRLHTEAIALFTRTNDRPEVANQLAALGKLYFRVGDLHRAQETLAAAILEMENGVNTTGLANTLRTAANVADALGDHRLALAHLRRSLRADNSGTDRLRAHVIIAGQLRLLGDLRGAAAELRQPLAAPNTMIRADAVSERGRVHMARGDLPAAIADLRAADASYRELSLDFSRIDNNVALSQAFLATGDVQSAATVADEAIALVIRIRMNSANPEWRARFSSSSYAPYEARIDAELAAREPGPANYWRAFRVAEEVRASSLAELVTLNERTGARRVDPEVEALRTRLSSLQLRLESRLQQHAVDEPVTAGIRRAIVETHARFEAAQQRPGNQSGNSSAFDGSLADIQARLSPDTAVLAYFVGERSTHAWLLTTRELRHATLPGRRQLEVRIRDFVERQRRGARGNDPLIVQAVLGPLLDGVTQSSLLVLPDGPLNTLPFAALPLPRGGAGKQLVDRFVIANAPSLTLALRAVPLQASAAQPQQVVVVSDPVYSTDDRRVHAATGGGERDNRRLPRLARLPYSAQEAQAVIAAFPGAERTELSGFEATAERVLLLQSQELDVLHFATHAVARRDAPEQSALFLTAHAANGSPVRPDRLTAAEIAHHGLRANMVVLSGCATGDGRELRGEGVLGLAYAFLANGSNQVVVSLWPVEDAFTARFMTEFYAAYRISGSAAEAIRAAQLRVRGTPGAASWFSFAVRVAGPALAQRTT
jgi:CHAT domain-containing protein